MLGPNAGVQRQTEVYVAGVAGARPAVPVDAARLEAEAARAMTPEAFAYVAGGAGTESTVRENRAGLERWRIVPRVLRDVSERDLSVELFGRRLATPLLLAPIGVLEMAHEGADVAVARAAAAEGVPMVFSSQASRPMEACAAAMGAAPRWFQLYWSKDDALVRSFVARAEACGCDAIAVTLDTTLLGWRTRDLDLAYLPFLRGMGIAQYASDPVFRAALSEVLPEPPGAPPRRINLSTVGALLRMKRTLRPTLGRGDALAAVRRFVATYSRPSLTWKDLETLRAMTRLPIVLKGVMHPDDARLALEHGASGVWVSNHGGRQVDGALSSIDALPAIADAVGGRAPVVFDGGVRGGSDAFKALALGATAVALGRPYVYGLALAGETGVREVIRNLAAELDLTMGLAGCRSPAEVGREALVRP